MEELLYHTACGGHVHAYTASSLDPADVWTCFECVNCGQVREDEVEDNKENTNGT